MSKINLFHVVEDMNDEVSNRVDMLTTPICQIEIKRITKLSLDKIHNDINKRHYISIAKKRPSKKRITILVASLIMAFTLTSIAYATDFFELGILNLWGTKVESPYEEGSNQYKAHREYIEYLQSLSEKKHEDLVNKNIINADLDQSNGGKSQNVLYDDPKKVDELCHKYNLLKEERVHTETKKNMALKKAGVENFLGNFEEKIDKTIDDYSENFYWYNKGTLHLSYGNCDMTVVPKNVFSDTSLWNSSEIEKKKSGNETWIYTTKDGYKIKCSYHVDKHLKHESYIYNFVYISDDNTLLFSLEEYPAMVNRLTDKNAFEKIIDSLDLDVL